MTSKFLKWKVLSALFMMMLLGAFASINTQFVSADGLPESVPVLDNGDDLDCATVYHNGMERIRKAVHAGEMTTEEAHQAIERLRNQISELCPNWHPGGDGNPDRPEDRPRPDRPGDRERPEDRPERPEDRPRRDDRRRG